jgi:hypothetical protein
MFSRLNVNLFQSSVCNCSGLKAHDAGSIKFKGFRCAAHRSIPGHQRSGIQHAFKRLRRKGGSIPSMTAKAAFVPPELSHEHVKENTCSYWSDS